MSANYVLLERIELNASAASVTFSNIPQSGYTDLKILFSARNTSNASVVYFTCNGTATNRAGKVLYGSGSAIGSLNGDNSDARIGLTSQSDYTSNTFSNCEIYIPNYTSSNYKSISADAVQENNASTAYAYLTADLWSDTAAITSFTLTPISGSFAQYSTFSLYGIAATGTTPVITPKATGGDIIINDGTYWYHAFLSSGTFTPGSALTCDTLVVAGGGAGGGGGTSSGGAGGGAGGVRLVSSLAYTKNIAYAVAIGAGGATGGTTTKGRGFNGNTSTINGYSASGGGGAGSISTNSAIANGSNGGSGGGGTATAGIVFTAGTGNAGGYSPVEGYNGGIGATDGSSYDNGGGGGGAGAVGVAANSAGGGNGGVGAGGTGYTNYAILNAMGSATTTGVLSSGNYYYGGGGGGAGYAGVGKSSGSGGLGGGGGAFSTNTTGTAGTANTGGGGGGSSVGGSGGSGIVIVRYTIA